MAGCVWRSIQYVYCNLPYIECSHTPPVKTCLELWMEAMAGNMAALQRFVATVVFATTGIHSHHHPFFGYSQNLQGNSSHYYIFKYLLQIQIIRSKSPLRMRMSFLLNYEN
ncbi:hypothetical protein HNY73_019809 [Argiope bruennichi]|uniref:Uncharacterized protein n=1 Tax=Argiope bruennichi TaxID=94029 RepID=A0A8T0E609_ARGBR|nr:hypothetical protein HNY73_019809 [Argiope bruennichi]